MKVNDLIKMLSEVDGNKEVRFNVSLESRGYVNGGVCGVWDDEICVEDFNGDEVFEYKLDEESKELKDVCIVNVGGEEGWVEGC